MATEVKHAACPCGAQDGGEAHSAVVDPEVKHSIGTRLRRIEGQIRGLQKMIEEERYCADVLMQLSSVQEALRGVSRGLLHNHLKHCVSGAIRADDPARAEEMYDEFMDLSYRSVR